MKNTINNEQLISITDLKKQAKIERKQNNKLSNHSESLKAIAKEYNYDSWEKLIDSSYLIINQQKPSFQTDQKEQVDSKHQKLLSQLNRITSLLTLCHDQYEFFNNSTGYNSLFNFFQLNVLNQHVITSPTYQIIKLLIDFMLTSFIEHQSKLKDFKDILNYASFSKKNPYYQEKLSENAQEKLRKYMKFNDLHSSSILEHSEISIEDTLQIENCKNHNEITLILNSVQEKINIMSISYNVIENNKKDNTYFNKWISDYENLINLNNYDKWVEYELDQYQSLMKQYYLSFFNVTEHKKVLEYLTYYTNNKFGNFSISGTKKEVIKKMKLLDEYKEYSSFDLEKANKLMLLDVLLSEDIQQYEFTFYYIIH